MEIAERGATSVCYTNGANELRAETVTQLIDLWIHRKLIRHLLWQ